MKSIKIFFFCYSLSFSLVLVGCGQSRSEKCQRFYHEYRALLKGMEGHYDTSIMINFLKEMNMHDSLCIDAYLTQADLYLAVDSLKNAGDNCTRVTLIDSNN